MATPEALRPPTPPEHYNVQVTIDHVTEAHEAPNPSIAYNRNATSTIKVERKVSHVVQLTVTADTLPEAIARVRAHLLVHDVKFERIDKPGE